MGKLKRILAPSFWKVRKKEYTWVVSPSPGPHKKFECFPLLILIRDVLKIVDKGKEAKKIIRGGEVYVDSKIRRDYAFPVGLFDTIFLPKLNKAFRVVPDKKGLRVVEVSNEEKDLKICRIENKTMVKNSKMQINLNDGKNIIASLSCKVGDSLLLKLPKLEIVQHLPLEKNSLGIIVKGRNAGRLVKILDILPGKFRVKPKVFCDFGDERREVLRDYVFVVGKESPLITVG